MCVCVYIYEKNGFEILKKLHNYKPYAGTASGSWTWMRIQYSGFIGSFGLTGAFRANGKENSLNIWFKKNPSVECLFYEISESMKNIF